MKSDGENFSDIRAVYQVYMENIVNIVILLMEHYSKHQCLI